MTNGEKLGVLGIVVGVASMGYSIYTNLKINKATEVINTSIGKIAKDIDVDVSQDIIDRAVEIAVNREVNKAVKTVSYEVSENIRRDITNRVRTAVNESYSDVRNLVSDKISKEAANIDMNKLRDDVKERAKAEVLDKFNENLDDLLKDFKQNLANLTKIYGAIADDMVKKPQETVVRIGL